MTDDMLDYIRKELKHGQTREQITESLVAAGRDHKDVDDLFFTLDEHEADRDWARKKHLTIVIVIGILAVAGAAYAGVLLYDSSQPAPVVPNTIEEDRAVLDLAIGEREPERCDEIDDPALGRFCAETFNTPELVECDVECEDKQLMINALSSDNRTLCTQIQNNNSQFFCNTVLDSRGVP